MTYIINHCSSSYGIISALYSHYFSNAPYPVRAYLSNLIRASRRNPIYTHLAIDPPIANPSSHPQKKQRLESNQPTHTYREEKKREAYIYTPRPARCNYSRAYLRRSWKRVCTTAPRSNVSHCQPASLSRFILYIYIYTYIRSPAALHFGYTRA